MREQTIGILGGMGPAATADFFSRVVALTPARRDQDHFRIIIDNNPKIPDRTEAILKGDSNLLPMLIETATNLTVAGADFIAMPCNTAHYFYDALAVAIDVPILHMIREVADALATSRPHCTAVGLLATSGTVTAGLYQIECNRRGIDVLLPDLEEQASLMQAILRIKEGVSRPMIVGPIMKAVSGLLKRNAQALILGCTELPLAVNAADLPVPTFDSIQVLAEATVKFAKA